ncbi:MAG: hypothetical protein JO091_10850, partial [Acidobacteriaceae bacterium]|nr:hypothetical protein [Acidobacteriaceae bacterium]
FGAPAFWNQHLYILGSNDSLSDFALKNGKLSPKPVATWDRGPADPGASPTVSANGAKDGIVWIIGSRRWTSIDATAVLHAYEAANIKHELYNSDQNRTRDQAGEAVRFAIPTVANGRVYVGAFKELDVYALFSLGRTK